EDFIKYLYSKKTKLELEVFKQNARNIKKKIMNKLKEDSSLIEYKEVELKQVFDEDTTSYIKKFVANMKLIGVEVPKLQFKYYVIYKHEVKEV
ncbi:474_t:CDS:2, partial [Cetraspora pellucida]